MKTLRCAAAAELAGDPLDATAPPADHWLLVEHAGPWGRHAITESRLQPDVAAALAHWTRTNKARVALIRRPGAPHRTRKTGLWYLIDARPGLESTRWGSYSDEHQLIDVLAAGESGESGQSGEPPGQPSEEPVYLVCTHGRHDTCCALRGRPVADALARAFPSRTWECTHLGGDRFAANLVLLPHGLYYGQVTPREAVDLVKQHAAGSLDLERLRGRSSLPAPVQAAQHHARLATGETALDSYPPLACELTGPDEWRVRLAGPNGETVTVTIRSTTRQVARPLTCAGPSPDRFRFFELVQLRRQPL